MTLVATKLLEAQATIDAGAEKDLRPAKFGALQGLIDNEGIAANLKELKVGEAQPTYIRTWLKDATAADSARTCSPSGFNPNTTKVAATFTTKAASFIVRREELTNNYLGGEFFVKALQNTRNRLYAAHNVLAQAFLEANKTTVEGARSGLATFDAVNHISTMAWADAEQYLNYIMADLEAEDYNGDLVMIHSNNMRALLNKMMQHGANNDSNQAMQLAYPMQHYFDSLTASTGNFLDSFVFEKLGAGAVSWIPEINRAGDSTGAESWYSIPDPVFGQIAVFEKTGCADSLSTYYGKVQDKVTTVELSVDLAFILAPTTTGSTIYKYGLLKA